jgi:predicted amidohydrolase
MLPHPGRYGKYARFAVLAGILSATALGNDLTRDSERSVTVVALQAGRNHFREGNPGPQANFDELAQQAREAAASRPDLIVFPEYALSGWPYPPEREMNALAEPVPGDGPWYRRYRDLARELDTPLVGWLLESDNRRLYNCAVVLNRDGEFVGKYRKVHANLGEQTWWGWSQGNSFEPIELGGVRYGFSICADMWFPETVRCGELLGADIIVHLSIADDMGHLVPARAFDAKLPIVMSIFQGGSYAVDASGTLLGKLSPDEPGWQAFELKPFQRDIGRKYGGLWDVKLGNWNVRHPSAYSILVDPTTRPAWTTIFFDNEGNPQSREQLIARFRGRYDAHDPENALVRFDPPWTSPYRVDPARPYQLVNDEGKHLWILNKTAWAYFGCQDPEGVLDRAREQGVNVLRVALEGTPYFDHLGIDLWPWAGTREQPNWSGFNEAYWTEVERRVRLAGEKGIGLDIVLYMNLRPGANDIDQQRPYWEEILRRLGPYANVLTWEIANETLRNEEFQDAAGRYLVAHDRHQRPVCTSDGTTDDAAWPQKEWVGLAINHSCTSSTPRHPLRGWYLAVARNTRAHGKPAWCNESGRERRHGNDDGIHRRKQGWLWNAAGCFWTHHSWEGCEGIDDPDYRAPGQEFLRPMAEFWQSVPFASLAPNETAAVITSPDLVATTLADNDRTVIVAYACTEGTGVSVPSSEAKLRLPAATYEVRFIRPADNTVLETGVVRSEGLHQTQSLMLPPFTDDLAIVLVREGGGDRRRIPGTE